MAIIRSSDLKEKQIKSRFQARRGTIANPVYSILRNGEWKDERCFLIGGGSSLRDFDFSRLIGKGRIITINKGFLATPFADICFFMDERFYREWIVEGGFGSEIVDKFRAFPGLKVFLDIHGRNYWHEVYHIRDHPGGREGISSSLQEGLYHGGNSGYAALQLAIVLGCNPIYLLGYDMKFGQDGKTHWHEGYPANKDESPLPGEQTYHGFASNFMNLAPKLKEKGIKVINLNPDSGLKCFEFGDIGDVLK